MLRLVHPARVGQEGGDPPKRRPSIRQTPAFTDVEAMRLRAALRNLRALYGTWACLASVMGMNPGSLEPIVSGRRRPSPAIALATAKAAGKTLDALIRPPGPADKCPTCGACRDGAR
ncbi:MAG: transcriptional regulator [Polyangiaceae bacterium]|nr:transcriptional regulator [Polyangiaceae bacterium]